MGKGGSAPKPPNPQKVAQAQTGQNITTGIANNIMGMMDQRGPGGASLTYNQTGTKTVTDPNTGQSYEVPQYSQTQSGGWAADQAINFGNNAQRVGAETAFNQAKALRSSMADQFNLGGLPGKGQLQGYGTPNDMRWTPNMTTDYGQSLPGQIKRTYGTDFSEDRQRVEDALMQRLNPQIEQDREQMRTQLANQGIGMGSDAYGSAQDDFGRSVNDARLGAILAGGQEQSRLAGLEAQRAGFENSATGQMFDMQGQRAAFGNQAKMQDFGMGMDVANFRDGQRGQAIQERLLERNQPLNEMAALSQFMPNNQQQFNPYQPGRMPTTDMAGLINSQYNQQAGNYQAQQDQRGSLFGNVLGAAGMLGSAFISDRRLKRDIRVEGRRGPLTLYSYGYVWDKPGTRHRGYMAQEVAQIVPSAVVNIGPWLALDYAQLPEV